MKKYLSGLAAVVLAVLGFVSTSANVNKAIDCTLTLHYFQVTTTGIEDCDLAAQSLSFPIPAAQEEFTTRAAQPFGCEDDDLEICAIGYRANQVTQLPNGTFVLNQGVNVLDYECCVRKTAQP